MNKDAYSILNKKGLPTPTIYSLDMIKKIPLERKYYLRYTNGSSDTKTGNEILMNQKEFIEHKQSKELLQIEDVIKTKAGGAIYIYNGIIYGEYCEGNPILLLRRGLCGRRFLLENNTKLHTLSCSQNWVAKQESSTKYEWEPFASVISNKFDVAIDYIKTNINVSETGLLIEFLITDNGIVFCDAKYQNLEVQPQKLIDCFVEKNTLVLLKGNIEKQKYADAIIDINVDNSVLLVTSV